jgi:hypothetical protein
VEALYHLNAANIELVDIALRRPSLDEVFLALTSRENGDTSAVRVEPEEPEGPSGRHRLERNGDTPVTRVEVGEPGDASGRHRLERTADTSATRVEVGEPGDASGRHRWERTADTSATRSDAEVLP